MRKQIYEIVKIFLSRFGVGICVVFVAGILLSPLEKSAWDEVRKTMPEVSSEALSESAGTGVALATLGGFRTVLADIAWLRSVHFWSKKDAASCESCMALARTLDPMNYFFWENSVSTIAYDFPAWTIIGRGGSMVSDQVQSEIHRKAFESALELLDQMEKQFPGQGKVFTYSAQLTLIKTAMISGTPDFERVMELYRRAMESREIPWFAFFAYANIAKERFPERVPAVKEYFQNRLKNTRSPSLKKILEEVLADFDR